jgi:hypothetical protein
MTWPPSGRLAKSLNSRLRRHSKARLSVEPLPGIDGRPYEIEDRVLLVLVVRVGHRREVYRR